VNERRIRVPIKVHFCAYRICHCHRSIKSDRICQDKKELLRLISTLGGAEREFFALLALLPQHITPQQKVVK
jgi:hypothetical protein